MTVEPGEFAALYGPSGSGKTTLLTLAAGIAQPDGGQVYFGGRDIASLGERESARYRRQEVGFIFQSFHLMAAASVLDNAALKLLADGWSLSDARREAEPWIERVGLGRRIDHVPGQLSTGECQRVAIARALVNQPRLVLADEPTGNLDTKRGRDVLELLRALATEQQIPVLLVTHDSQAIEIVDHLHVLRDGRLTAADRAFAGMSAREG